MTSKKEVAEKKDLFPQELPEHAKQGSGRGNEDVGGDRSIARLNLLQAMSPQVTPGKAEYNEDAKAGMIFNTDTGQLFSEVLLINMYYYKNWAIFKKQDHGGGFEGNYDTPDAAEQYFKDNPTLVRTQYDVVETAHHFCIQIDEEGNFLDAVEILMSSTKLKVSDSWNTQIQNKGQTSDRFSTVWRLKPKLQSGKNHSWYNYNVEFVGYTPESMYQDCLDSYEFLKAKREAVAA